MSIQAAKGESPFSIQHALSHISLDFGHRFVRAFSRLETGVLTCLSLLPVARAGAVDAPVSNITNSDVQSLTALFNFTDWKQRGDMIRRGNKVQCIGNLSIVLSGLGPLFTSDSSGSSGALSLLPTAGALIGAPAKELWVLYKLMPIAGVLSMLLSLGGNIVPMQTSEYEVTTNAFQYDGLIATSRETEKASSRHIPRTDTSVGSEAQDFANQVAARSLEHVGSTKRMSVFVGVVIQLCWIGILLFACWITQIGGVVAWWCKAWGWMLLWYLMVVMSSLLENFAGVPFSKQWTIRVSKAPSRLRVSEDAPVVASENITRAVMQSQSLLHLERTLSPSIDAVVTENTKISPAYNNGDIPRKPVAKGNSVPVRTDENFGFNRSDSYFSQSAQAETTLLQHTDSYLEPFTPGKGDERSDILQDLDIGYNTTGRVMMDPNEPWALPRVPFYVIVSLEGISTQHALLRVASKAISVGVFAAGTATFASATLITISVALTVLCLVLGAGVFGRVIAMWMAAEMMKTDPVLHRVVKSRAEAAEHIRAVLAKPGLTCELMGHVIINGRCVKRYNKWFRLSTIFGVLAPPFDITKIAMKR